MKLEGKKIGFVIVMYKIEESFLNDFLKLNEKIIKHYVDQILIVTDRDIKTDNEKVKVLVYPVKMEQFNFSKLLNYGIKRCDCDIIIKTDIDIVFSQRVIKHISAVVAEKRGVVHCCSNLNGIETIDDVEWEELGKRETGYGACFAMTRTDWHELRGYNENFVGWGGEDTDLFERAVNNIVMIKTIKRPLYHLLHEKRTTVGEGTFWDKKTQRSIEWARKKPWNDDKWGEI